MDYLSFRHHTQYFAVPIDAVRFIAAENALKPTQVSTGNSRQFDMVDYDGQACAILSLARLLNQPSERTRSRDLVRLLHDREQDHLSWISALRNALENDTPFEKQRNPDLCAFGQWYRQFTTDDPQLSHIMSRFDKPHRRLHALADELLTLSEQGRHDDAMAILSEHEAVTLSKLTSLFAEARDIVQMKVRPTVIMLQVNESQVVGLKVDDVGEVFECRAEQADQHTDYLPAFAKRWLKEIRSGKGTVTVMEIGPGRLLSSAA